ncbi:ras-related and estrogen-regulated growth inhibitor-like protein [Tachypleus tridentatus]|uniref:ras-related and estrogen-regulated growth inhibitor-like protein n=1 Tax=Tachypleus tridentatus TaxID=6853 RepID=UPI003FD07F0F
MTNCDRLKVVILGNSRVGKSAVTVRYLTKRYIGEYSSFKDYLYQHSVSFDNVTTEVEILDTSACKTAACLHEHISWANAFVLVYSICEKASFQQARVLLETISAMKGLRYAPVILLGNKRDLEHVRQVGVDDGHEMSLQFQCQFYEVSAAENYVGVSLAFQSLIREARAMQALKTLPVRRKVGAAMTVSKMIGMVFGKSGKSLQNGKKRPSLSI